MDEEEERFWLRQDLESSEALELGVLPPDIQMEEVGQRVMWGPAIELALEGLPLAPLTEVLNRKRVVPCQCKRMVPWWMMPQHSRMPLHHPKQAQ